LKERKKMRTTCTFHLGLKREIEVRRLLYSYRKVDKGETSSPPKPT
jgi:hypothetical protein